jgi:hypothetical protein
VAQSLVRPGAAQFNRLFPSEGGQRVDFGKAQETCHASSPGCPHWMTITSPLYDVHPSGVHYTRPCPVHSLQRPTSAAHQLAPTIPRPLVTAPACIRTVHTIRWQVHHRSVRACHLEPPCPGRQHRSGRLLGRATREDQQRSPVRKWGWSQWLDISPTGLRPMVGACPPSAPVRTEVLLVPYGSFATARATSRLAACNVHQPYTKWPEF